MDERSTSTALPPLRRAPRRRWGRLVARVLCALLSLVALVPLGIGLLVRTTWARGLATAEARRVLSGYAIDARFEVQLRLWPLSASLRNVRVASTDGGAPFLTARRATARPKIFGLLAGKLVIDEIEVDRPAVRVVLAGGKLQNLAPNLPETPKETGPSKPPFSVVSASDAEIDLDVDGRHVVARGIDADVTADDDGHGGAAFEIALRVVEARHRDVRTLTEPKDGRPGEYAVDEDVICRLDGRARVEPKRVVVRRLSAFAAADLDPAEDTAGTCAVARSEKRFVELQLGHFTVDLPQRPDQLPSVDGHVKARAPVALANRVVPMPDLDGWVALDVEVRAALDKFPDKPLQDLVEATGRLDAEGIRVDKFSFARAVKSDFAVRRGVVTSPVTRVEIAGGVAELRDVEVRPFEEHRPLKGNLEARDVSFTSLMRDLGVSEHPHVTWDIDQVRATDLKGTLDPLQIDGDLTAKTANFAVFDAAVDDPGKRRATGVREGHLLGKVAIRANALEFRDIQVTTTHSVVRHLLVSIGFHDVLRVDVPSATVDLSDLSPLGSVRIAGVAALKASVSGLFGDPRVEGDVLSIKDFAIGERPTDIQFGAVTQAHVALEKLAVLLRDVRATKGKSAYEMPTGRLEFGGAATMTMDGTVTSKALDARDFLSVFHMDDDPRFEEIGGVLETNARMHLALGGPEDVCKGGFLDVQAVTTARELNLFGERFDEGQADLEYRWIDRQAGVEGADIDVRSLSLSKVRKAGRAALGSVLGSVSVRRGGELRGSLVLQGFPLGRFDMLGPAAASVEGAASGLARLGGTLTAYAVEADLDVTPVRIMNAPFGSSDLHVVLTQKPPAPRVIGRTPCGAPVTAPFDKDAYVRELAAGVQGDWRVDGKLFGGQVRLDDVRVTRQKWPVATGKIALDGLDLAPIGRLSTSTDEAPPEPGSAALGGLVTGDIVLERIATSELARAKATFTPRAMKLTRGGQRLEWRPPATPAPVTLALADDEVKTPPLIFDVAAGAGFSGAVGVTGSVRKVTHGGELALDAELSPIDLGILVGAVPRLTRATGRLSGSLRLTGKASRPQFDGQLRVRGGDFVIKGLPGSVTGVDVDIVADASEVRVTRGNGRFLGGDVSLTAHLPIKGGQLGVMEASVAGRQLFIAPIEGVKATVDADLRVTMNPNATTAQGRLPFVGGEVAITSFDYTKPLTLELGGLSGGARRTVVEAYDPSLDSIALGFDVRSRAPLRVRNNLVEAQLAIAPQGLHVTGTNQRVGLRGEVASLPGGRFRLFANDFDVQKASIRFDDPTRIAPRVDATAITEYRRYTNTLSSGAANTTGGAGAATGAISSGGRGGGLWRIALHAFGDGDNLHVDMTSDPALSSEDIFFLLTIGLTRAEVDQVQAGSVYASAAFEAIGTVSGVDRAVKQAIPVIDDFRPGTAYSQRTGRVEPNITVGRRIGENVRARLTSGLAEDPQLRSAIEWRLNRSLTVEPSYDRINTVSSSNVGNFGLDFRWRFEFD